MLGTASGIVNSLGHWRDRLSSSISELRAKHPNNRGQGRKAPKRPERAEGERIWIQTVFTHLCVDDTEMYIFEGI